MSMVAVYDYLNSRIGSRVSWVQQSRDEDVSDSDPRYGKLVSMCDGGRALVLLDGEVEARKIDMLEVFPVSLLEQIAEAAR